MRVVSFYHKETGVLHPHRVVASDDAAVALNTPPDHIAIDGHHDPESQRVDIVTGEVVDAIPDAPSADYEWNVATRRWQLHAVAAARAAASAAALAQIRVLETAQHRAVREAMLGDAAGLERLKKLEREIQALRQHL